MSLTSVGVLVVEGTDSRVFGLCFNDLMSLACSIKRC